MNKLVNSAFSYDKTQKLHLDYRLSSHKTESHLDDGRLCQLMIDLVGLVYRLGRLDQVKLGKVKFSSN